MSETFDFIVVGGGSAKAVIAARLSENPACRVELEDVGIQCLVYSLHVGKQLKDHIQVPLFFPAPDVGLSMAEVGLSMGPMALRHPAGPLPANPEDDEKMPAELQVRRDRKAARGGCERHAQRGQREHERGVDHDWRKGGGDGRRGSWREAHGVRERASR